MSTHRRTWDTKEWNFFQNLTHIQQPKIKNYHKNWVGELRAKERIASQPEPYKIWASQKSHRPKFLDKDMSLKRGRQNQEKEQQRKQAASNPEKPPKEQKLDENGKVLV